MQSKQEENVDKALQNNQNLTNEPPVVNLIDKKKNIKLSPYKKLLPAPQVLEFETMKLPKIYTPYTYIMYSNKLAEAKEKFKDSMKELGFEMASIDPHKWGESMLQGEALLKKSQSVKYLGIKNGQIGILSKRTPIPITTEKNKKNGSNFEKPLSPLLIEPNQEYIVNKYSLPRHFHAVSQKKPKKKQNFDFYPKQSGQKFQSSENEAELKIKIKKLIDKKKENMREKAENKIKNSLDTWSSLTTCEKKPKELKSYSSQLKSFPIELPQKEARSRIEKLKKAVFIH